MRITLDYGRTGLEVELPDDRLMEPLDIAPLPPLADAGKAVAAALAAPIGSAPLAELARGRRDACILVCDITRPVPNKIILRPLLETLESAGIPRDRILLLIATGLHRPNEGDELTEILGEEIASSYRVENHHGRVKEEHTYLGTTPRGVPAWIDTRYLEADLKITTGLIEPHLMAGYSGGRKVICPGIVHLETLKVWHGPQFLEHPKADCGFLEGNPVHEENTRIARMAGCDFIVNVTLDRDRKVTGVVAGDMEEAFLAGVQIAERAAKASMPREADVVVTSSAGYPLDTTFYQAIKGLTGALPAVKEGGTIVMAAGLSEGIGSAEFQQCLRDNADLEEFVERIESGDYFMLDQWQLEELAKVRRKARVKLFTDGLTDEELRHLFVEPAESVEQAAADSLAEYGPSARLAVIPKGPYVVPEVATA